MITGPSVLDKILPNWFKSINTESLDLTSSYNCILGQIYGNFAIGWKELKLYETQTAKISELGFLGTKTTDRPEWIKAVNKRKGVK